MREMVLVNRQSIDVKEYEGKRVVTLRDVDNIHDRPTGTARRNFNDNKSRFICGVDYFVRNSYEAKNEYSITAPNGLILLTESGYLMLVKSFNDDLSWSVQRELVNNYFNHTQGISQPTNHCTYNNRPVVTIRQIAEHVGIGVQTAQNRFRLHKDEFTYGTEYEILYGCTMEQFKAQNAGFSGISKLTIFTPKGARRMLELCNQYQQTKAIPAKKEQPEYSIDAEREIKSLLETANNLKMFMEHAKSVDDKKAIAQALRFNCAVLMVKTEDVLQAK